MRSGRWKLKLPNAPTTKPARPQPVMLFDLDADPNETTNLAGKNSDVVARLRAMMTAIAKTAKK